MDINLDWRAIAGAVAPLAPKLGAVLGAGFGPFGGIIGGLAGNALAGYLGTAATPDAVGKAIAEDPAAAAKIKQAEAERGNEIFAQAQVEIERLKAQTEQYRIGTEAGTSSQDAVNQTMRAEMQARVANKSTALYFTGWRPAAAWLLVGLVGAIGFAIVWSVFDAIRTNDNATLTLVLNSLFAITAFLSIPGAIVGVTAWGRSYEVGQAVKPAEAAAANAPIATSAQPLDVGAIIRETIRAVKK